MIRLLPSFIMGFFDAVGDLLSVAMPWGEVEAEAPPKEEEEKVCKISYHSTGRGQPVEIIYSQIRPDNRSIESADVNLL